MPPVPDPGSAPPLSAEAWEASLKRKDAPESIPLSQVVNSAHTGLDLLDPAAPDVARLWKRTRNLLGYRQGRLSSDEMADLVGDCIIRPQQTPQCHFLSREWEREWGKNTLTFLPMPEAEPRDQPEPAGDVAEAEDEAEEGADRAPASVQPLSRSQIVGALQDGDMSALEPVKKRALYKALDQFSTWQPLRATVTRALGGSCPRVQLLTALGFKAEEYFPAPEAMEAARSLYRRAHECGPAKDEDTAKARYRLALLYVWRAECSKAEPIWENLAAQPGGMYISRASYWLGHCAERKGNRIRANLLHNRLLKENPIGFHTLLVNRGVAAPIRNLVLTNDPQVRFRTAVKPELNQVVMTAELLQGIHADGLAQELLQFLREQAVGTEPEFQLYVGVLAMRVGDRVTQFKILADLFRDSPHLLSAGTLRLFYPLKRYPTLWRHADWVNPYLALALIRQESAFNENARSPVGALGLMQLMPDTARTLARVNKRQLLDPSVNLKLGVQLFRKFLDKFKGDAELALAAYNAGPNKVQDWVQRYPVQDRVLFLDLIPFSETRNYVALITRNYLWYLTLYAPEMLEKHGPRRGIASAGRGAVFRTLDSM